MKLRTSVRAHVFEGEGYMYQSFITVLFIAADFFLLLFMSLQLRVFRIEASEHDYIGGSNKSVLDEGRGRRTLLKVNSEEKVEEIKNAAVPDFIGKSFVLLFFKFHPVKWSL